MVKAGNPFIGYVEVTSLVSKIVSTCSQDVYKLEALGKEQVQEFVKAVFIDKTRSIYDPIKQNKIGFFKKHVVKDNTVKLNKTSLDIVTNMFFAAQQRNINEVKDLLKYEVALPPPSLTKPTTGKARFAQKAKLVESLVTFMHKT